MRISDVFRLRCSDFRDGRLYYIMSKNGKAGSLKVSARAQAIMDQYRRVDICHDLIFPDLEAVENYNDEWEIKRKIKTRIRRVGEFLDLVKEKIKLTKKLDPYIARHTFGFTDLVNLATFEVPCPFWQQLLQ